MIQRLFRRVALFAFLIWFSPGWAHAAEAVTQPKSIDQKIDKIFEASTSWFVKGVFTDVVINDYPVKVVVLWLGLAGVVMTLIFKFINLSGFGLAMRTVKGRYSEDTDPGEISHFQALSAAVSGTVGLGNIAGVAIGIMIGGPGVAFWLFLSGFLGMATKFAECTASVTRTGTSTAARCIT